MALSAVALATPTAAQGATKEIRSPIPEAGNAVFVEVRGRGPLPGLPNLALRTPTRLEGTVASSSLWRKKRATNRFDGIILLVDRPGPPPSPRAGNNAVFELSGVTKRTRDLVEVRILQAVLAPRVGRDREAAARAACRNKLRNIGVAAHAYHDDGQHATGPWSFNRHVCGAYLDERLPGSPEFWARLGQPYCGLRVARTGVAREGRIFGSCNYALERMVVTVAPNRTVTDCQAFTGAGPCTHMGNQSGSTWSTPWPAYDAFEGTVQVDGTLNFFQSWTARAFQSATASARFPTDPTRLARIFD